MLLDSWELFLEPQNPDPGFPRILKTDITKLGTHKVVLVFFFQLIRMRQTLNQKTHSLIRKTCGGLGVVK